MSELSLIQPFAAYRPQPAIARLASAPPYDVLDSNEARIMAADNPYSFLRISKAEITLPEDTPAHDPIVYQTAAANLQQWIADGWFIQDEAPRYYLYRLVMNGHEQTGLVAAASVDAYLNNRIKKHELTRTDKENDRTEFARATSSHSGPVFLVYRQANIIQQLMDEAAKQTPTYDFVSDDGIGHTLWVIDHPDLILAITNAFETL
ncbi:MAG: DUF1015 domain-containing protein, partial [Magnetococcales bacterium]|nr:DUF1015 domain-containing protein [Magnetococcales bacterium]